MVALDALGSIGLVRDAAAAANGFGLAVTELSVLGRLHYYRFATSEIG